MPPRPSRVHTAIRLGQAALDEVDAIAEETDRTRSEVLRALLRDGLTDYRRRHPRRTP